MGESDMIMAWLPLAGEKQTEPLPATSFWFASCEVQHDYAAASPRIV